MQCIYIDTTFNIIERNSKTYVQFGKIEDEIIITNEYSVRLANLLLDSFNNGHYPVNGYYKNDSMHMTFSHHYLPLEIYNNSLDGKKQ